MTESNFVTGFFFIGAGEGMTAGGSGGRNGDAIVGFRTGGLGWGDGDVGVLGAGVDELEAGLDCSFANRLRRIC